MVSWLSSFVGQYHTDTSRWPVIYTTATWWAACTGSSAAFAGIDPLFIANYGGSPYPLASGWAVYTFWQYADHGIFPGDQDVFNGGSSRLVDLANNAAITLPSVNAPANGIQSLLNNLVNGLLNK